MLTLTVSALFLLTALPAATAYAAACSHTYASDCDGFCDLCGAEREAESRPGDANADGKLNVRDLGLFQQHLNGWDVDIAENAMDVDGDGNTNTRDLALLQQYLNGWDIELI